MNALFESFDAKMDAMLNGNSLLFLFSHPAGNPSDQFANYPLEINKVMGQRFFFINSLDRGQGFLGLDESFGGWAWQFFRASPELVDYENIFNWASEILDGMSRDESVQPAIDSSRKVLRMTEPVIPLNPNWMPTERPITDYLLSVVKSQAVGHPDDVLFNWMYPFHGAWPVSCEDPYASVELIFDGEGYDVLEFSKQDLERYSFFRIHNLNNYAMVVRFMDGDVIVHEVGIDARSCRCVRRTSPTTGYLNGFKYFHKFRSGDPRFYKLDDPISPVSGQPVATYGGNNIVNPWVVHYIFSRLQLQWQGGVNQAPVAPGLGGRPSFFCDVNQFWDASAIYTQNYPVDLADKQAPWITPSPTGRYFASMDTSSKIGDIIYHQGYVEMVSSTTYHATIEIVLTEEFALPYWLGYENLSNITVSHNGTELVQDLQYQMGRWESEIEVEIGQQVMAPGNFTFGPSANYNAIKILDQSVLQEGDILVIEFDHIPPEGRSTFVFRGFDDLLERAATVGLNLGTGLQGQMTLQADQTQLVSISSNLVSAIFGRPVADISTAISIPNLGSSTAAYAVEPIQSENSDTFFTFNESGTLTGDKTVVVEEEVGQTNPDDGAPVPVHNTTAEEILLLNWMGDPGLAGTAQETTICTFDRNIRFTGFGPVLTFTKSVSLGTIIDGGILSAASLCGVTPTAITFQDCTHLGSNGDWPKWYQGDGAFNSCRTERLYGERVWKVFSDFVPEEAVMFYPTGVAELGEPNFLPYIDYVQFKVPVIGDTVGSLVNTKKKAGIAYLSATGPFQNDVLRGLSAWWTRAVVSNWRPVWGITTWDLSTPGSWWQENKARLLANTPGEIDGNYGGRQLYFPYLPLLADHYNNLASIVNSIVAVYPLNFEWMTFRDQSTSRLPTFDISGAFNDEQGIYFSTLRPKWAYACWSENSALERRRFWDSFSKKFGLSIKHIDDLPASYLKMQEQAMQASPLVSYVGGVAASVELDMIPLETTVFDEFKASVFNYPGGMHTLFDWVDARELRGVTQSLGIPSNMQRLVEPVDIEVFEITGIEAKQLIGTRTPNTGTGKLYMTTTQGRRLAIVPVPLEQAEWVRTPCQVTFENEQIQMTASPIKLVDKPAPDSMTQWNSGIISVGVGQSSDPGLYSFNHILKYVIDTDYLKRHWRPDTGGVNIEPFFERVGVLNDSGRPVKVVTTPCPYFHLPTMFSDTGLPRAKAVVQNTDKRVVPSKYRFLNRDEEVILSEHVNEEFDFQGEQNKAVRLWFWFNDVSETP